MASHHETILRRVQLAASSRGARLLKNVVGSAWRGTLRDTHEESGAGTVVTIEHATLSAYGLLTPSGETDKIHGGSSDLIGWTPVIITPDMVGRKLAIFTAAEIKTKSYPTLSDDQKRFMAAVARDGGIAMVYREGEGGEIEEGEVKG